MLVSAFIFLTGIPISLYAARHAVDIDLLTRGSGFGYLGSTFSSLVYASCGINDGHFDWLQVGAAGTVVASVVAQIGQQLDSLRFMPSAQRGLSLRWWSAVLAAGPGWIFVGAAKMLGGAVLAYLAVRQGMAASQAIRPTQMYLVGFAQVLSDPAWILGLTSASH